jgi:protein O-GlcNAc transferase
VSAPPKLVLDIGCYAGANGRYLKQRYPDVRVVGLEPNPTAAQHAARHLDHVVNSTLEKCDSATLKIEPGTVDTVILSDVLEHMYNPWETLEILKPYLSPQAQLLVSIPNVRSLPTMGELAAGEWRYQREGVMDITHIRFFTLKSVRRLFTETGYRIEKLRYAIYPHLRSQCQGLPNDRNHDISVGSMTIKGLSAEEVTELCSQQFFMVVRFDKKNVATKKPQKKLENSRTLTMNELLQEARTHQEQGDYEKAERLYRIMLNHRPNHPSLTNDLGLLLMQFAPPRTSEAQQIVNQALKIHPKADYLHTTLGNILESSNQRKQAANAFRTAAQLNVDNRQAWFKMAIYESLDCEVTDQELPLDDQTRLKTLYLDALHETALYSQLDLFKVVAKRAEKYLPNNPEIQIARLFQSLNDEGQTPATLHTAYRTWYTDHLKTVPKPKLSSRKKKKGQIRVAYIGHYLHYNFLRGYLPHHDTKQIELTFITDDNRMDLAELNPEITTLPFSGTDLAATCQKLKIDIAIDMCGPYPGSRNYEQFQAFSNRLAPVQCGWITPLATCGGPAWDVLLMDSTLVPKKSRKHFVETIKYLPSSTFCWSPTPNMPEPTTLPANDNGFITFGSANRGNKITDSLLDLWIDVLAACPDSRFLIAGHHVSDHTFIARIETRCKTRNVDPKRVILQKFKKAQVFWPFYHNVDILLDTTPFNGCLTTLDALWMGVPVITLSGQTIAGRYGNMFNNQLGLDDWVATDRNSYISIARKKSEQLDELNELRQGLRERLAQSPICDGKSFARNLEKIFANIVKTAKKQPLMRSILSSFWLFS